MEPAQGVLVYVLDLDQKKDDDQINGNFKNEAVDLLSLCIQNKIFGGSKEVLCLATSDSLKNATFQEMTWDTLRDLETNVSQAQSSETLERTDLVQIFATIVKLINKQSKQDNYPMKRIVFISDFKPELDEQGFSALVGQLEKQGIFANFVTPEENCLDEKQKKTIDIVKNVVDSTQLMTIFSVGDPKVQTQIYNTVCKKAVRPTPWNITMEIGPDLTLNVSGYVCVRKNKSSETKQALLKIVEKLPPPKQVISTTSNDGNASSSSSAAAAQTSEGPSLLEITAQPTSKIVSKEINWTQNDGTRVEEEDIVNGYYYGDKLVAFDEIQQEHSFKTGDKCFKVLLFCPSEQIPPYYLVDDGNDLFFAKKDESDSAITFNALLQALHNTGKVAVVRKIRTKDAKLSIGVLSPDMGRKCLVYVNLCFADDVNLPKFPSLFKEEELDNSNNLKLKEKDDLMDQFISSLSIETFEPSIGPTDPAGQVFRENITKKMLGKANSTALALFDGRKKSKDGIQLYFENQMKQNSPAIAIDVDVKKQLSISFPCREIQDKRSERVAGVQVFRKRNVEDPAEQMEKKVKVEQEPIEEPVVKNPDAENGNQFDIDNLLDDL